jgi:hypothetical protein
VTAPVIPDGWRRCTPPAPPWTEADHPGCHDPFPGRIGPAIDWERAVNSLAQARAAHESARGGNTNPAHWIRFALTRLGPPLSAARLGHVMVWEGGGVLGEWRCARCRSCLLVDRRGPFGSALLHPCTGRTPR